MLAASCVVVSLSVDDSIWNTAIGGSGDDVARCVQLTSDGGYIVAGWTTSFGQGNADAWLVKVNASGNMEWNRTIGGAGRDEAYSVQVTNDGGYIVAGCTESSGAGLSDFWLIKTDVNGTVSWERKIGGVYADCAFCVQQTGDGGYVVAGHTESFGAGGSDYWLVKTDELGMPLWNRTYGGPGLDQAFSVVQADNGNGYVIAGQTDSLGAGGSDFWLVRTDSSGILLWSNSFGGSNNDVARSVQRTSDGGYVVAGWTTSFGAGSSDFMLLKVDGDGRQLWRKTYGDTFSEEAFEVQQTVDSGYMIAGSTSSYSLGGWDFWQVKTDANGNRQWDQLNGGASDDQAYSVKQTSDGGFILVGSTLSYGEGLDFWLAKNMPPPPRPPENDHDVAVTGVLPSRIIIGEGGVLAINVTVTNLGKYRETPMVFVYANGSVIDEPCQIPLEIGQNESFILFWNTSGFTKGTYMISAVAASVPGEEGNALANNEYDDGEVVVTIAGDVEGDLKVTISDLFSLGKAYPSDPSNQNWNLYCDIDQDDAVNLTDLQILSQNFGRTSG